MMKKIIALVSVAVMFLALTGPVSAYKNIAVIKDNNILTVANTGNNVQGNSVSIKKALVGNIRVGGDNSIITGDAKARSKFYIGANSNCFSDDLDAFAVVKRNVVDSEVNTGLNSQGNGAVAKKAMVVDNIRIGGDNSIITGSAKVKTKAWIVVNSNWLY